MTGPNERPELERRPHLALAAKLLVGLGLAMVAMLLGGQAANAADAPTGPLAQVDRATRAEPLRAVTREVTRTARAGAAPVAQISPRETPAARAPGERRAAHTARTARVLPRHDGTEALRLDLRLDREGLDVRIAPRSTDAAFPIRVQFPSLLPGLPSVDLSIVDGTVLAAGQRPTETAEATSAPATPRSDTAVAPADRSSRDQRAASSPLSSAPLLPIGGRSEGQLPNGVSAAAAAVAVVLGSLGLRAPARPGLMVGAAHRRVPLAPSFEPSFTPD